MSRFMRYGNIGSSEPLMGPGTSTPAPTYTAPETKSSKAAPKKLVAKASGGHPEIMAGAGAVSGKSKSPLKTLISGKPTEKDVREYLKRRVSDLMGDSSSDEED